MKGRLFASYDDDDAELKKSGERVSFDAATVLGKYIHVLTARGCEE